MIWLTWRQHRWEAAVGGLLVGLLAVVLIRSKLQLQAILDQFQLHGCSGRIGLYGNPGLFPCQFLSNQFNEHSNSTWYFLFPAMLVVRLWSACSLAPRYWPANSSTGRTAWSGRRASRAYAG